MEEKMDGEEEAKLDPKKHKCLWCKRIDMDKWDDKDRRWCKKHKKFMSPNALCDDWRYCA